MAATKTARQTSRVGAAAAARLATAIKVGRKAAKKQLSDCDAIKLQQTIERHAKLHADAKAAYAEMDAIADAVRELIGVENVVILPNGQTVKIANNFIDRNGEFRNVSYRPCGVRMYELSVK